MGHNFKPLLMSYIDYITPKGSGQNGGVQSKDRSTSYQNETVQPCYFNSSIYYGGREVYPTNL